MKETVQFNVMLPKALIQNLRAQREKMGVTWEEYLTLCLSLAARDTAARNRRSA